MELGERVAGMDSARVVVGGVFTVANWLQCVLDAVLPDITAKQLWLLVVLTLFDDPPTLGALAEASDTSHQNVRQLLRRLEAKGFVELAADAEDARSLRIRTTAKAAQWGEATDAQAREFLAAMSADLGPGELEDLAHSLMKIHSMLGRLQWRPDAHATKET